MKHAVLALGLSALSTSALAVPHVGFVCEGLLDRNHRLPYPVAIQVSRIDIYPGGPFATAQARVFMNRNKLELDTEVQGELKFFADGLGMLELQSKDGRLRLAIPANGHEMNEEFAILDGKGITGSCHTDEDLR